MPVGPANEANSDFDAKYDHLAGYETLTESIHGKIGRCKHQSAWPMPSNSAGTGFLPEQRYRPYALRWPSVMCQALSWSALPDGIGDCPNRLFSRR
jgi:hypothetical protein